MVGLIRIHHRHSRKKLVNISRVHDSNDGLTLSSGGSNFTGNGSDRKGEMSSRCVRVLFSLILCGQSACSRYVVQSVDPPPQPDQRIVGVVTTRGVEYKFDRDSQTWGGLEDPKVTIRGDSLFAIVGRSAVAIPLNVIASLNVENKGSIEPYLGAAVLLFGVFVAVFALTYDPL
jgi:hypothetical protein